MFRTIPSWFKCLFKMPMLWAQLWSQLEFLRAQVNGLTNLLDKLNRPKKVTCGILFFALGPGGKPYLCGRQYRLEPGEQKQDGIQPDCNIEHCCVIVQGSCTLIAASYRNEAQTLWNSPSMPAVMIPELKISERFSFILKADE